ncbi:MAG: hypothetical protein P1P88_21945, partial [Bacteroidales bacterium]|nr:hypothetical protein [Bacteroidales bacterium]
KIIPGGNQLLSKRSEMFLPNQWPAYYSKVKGCDVWDLDGNKYVDMSIIKFKQLEIKPEGSWFKRTLSSKQFRKSLIFIILGAVAGFAYIYFTEGQHMDKMALESVLRSVFFGAFMGFFVTNSPCARGRC